MLPRKYTPKKAEEAEKVEEVEGFLIQNPIAQSLLKKGESKNQHSLTSSPQPLCWQA